MASFRMAVILTIIYARTHPIVREVRVALQRDRNDSISASFCVAPAGEGVIFQQLLFCFSHNSNVCPSVLEGD
jgi:hypothetical protein